MQQNLEMELLQQNFQEELEHMQEYMYQKEQH